MFRILPLVLVQSAWCGGNFNHRENLQLALLRFISLIAYEGSFVENSELFSLFPVTRATIMDCRIRIIRTNTWLKFKKIFRTSWDRGNMGKVVSTSVLAALEIEVREVPQFLYVAQWLSAGNTRKKNRGFEDLIPL